MAANFSVAIVIKAIDRATAPIAKVVAAVNRVQKPLTHVLSTVQKMSAAAGLPKLRNAVTGAADALGNLTSRLRRTALWLTGVASALAAATFGLVRSTLRWGDEIGDTAARLGVSAERLQEWRRAAHLSGVGSDVLTQGLERLSKNVIGAARGSRTLVEMFARAGLSATDAHGRLLPLEALLPRIADRMVSIRNPLTRTTMAMALFGKSGAELIPMLLEGSTGLARIAQQARALGLVLSNEEIARLGKLSDEFDTWQEVIVSLARSIGSVLAPEVVDLMRKLAMWGVEKRDKIKDLAKAFGETLHRAVEKTAEAFEGLRRLLKPLAVLWDGLSAALGPLPALLLLVAGAITVSLVPSILSTIGALASLSAALVSTPAGWVVIALAAVAAAFAAVTSGIVLLIMNWDSLANRFPRLTALVEKLGFTLLRRVVAPILAFVNGVTVMLEALEKLASYVPESAFKALGIDAERLKPKPTTPSSSAPSQLPPALGLPLQIRDLRDYMATVNPARDPKNHAELAGAARFAALAGITGRRESRAAVQVDFRNMPRGTTVKPGPGNDVELDLRLGYTMFSP